MVPYYSKLSGMWASKSEREYWYVNGKQSYFGAVLHELEGQDVTALSTADDANMTANTFKHIQAPTNTSNHIQKPTTHIQTPPTTYKHL